MLVASTGDSRCVVVRRKQCSGSHSGSHGHSHSGSHGHGSGIGSGADSSSDVEVVPLTWDAKPSLPEEEKRIAQSGVLGCVVWRSGMGWGPASCCACNVSRLLLRLLDASPYQPPCRALRPSLHQAAW